jgi:hypothetical protein
MGFSPGTWTPTSPISNPTCANPPRQLRHPERSEGSLHLHLPLPLLLVIRQGAASGCCSPLKRQRRALSQPRATPWVPAPPMNKRAEGPNHRHATITRGPIHRKE